MNGSPGIARCGRLVWWVAVLWLGATRVHAQEAEEWPEFRNAIAFGGAYVYQIEAADEAGERQGENLGGFVIKYSRELIPAHLAIGLAKPFYFNRKRFDSPFELSLKGLFRRGVWEIFLGVVFHWNIRIGIEKLDEPRTTNLMSFGIGGLTGVAYYFTARWAVELEVAYEWIPSEDIVEHEIAFALGPVFRF